MMDVSCLDNWYLIIRVVEITIFTLKLNELYWLQSGFKIQTPNFNSSLLYAFV